MICRIKGLYIAEKYCRLFILHLASPAAIIEGSVGEGNVG